MILAPSLLLALLPQETVVFEGDWLIVAEAPASVVRPGAAPNELVLENGLIRRTFRLVPNAATVGYDNLMTTEAILRGVKPEAKVTLDGVEYAIGGLLGQPEYGYLRPEWLDAMTADPAAFAYVDHEVIETVERFPWKRVRYSEDRPWPPPGVGLALRFRGPPGPHENVEIVVRYEMYDGIPLTCKWFELANGTGRAIELDAFTSDLLAAVEAESDVELPVRWKLPNLHVESDYSMGGFMPKSAVQTCRWVPDPQYTSQVNYRRQTPNLLVVGPPLGPGIEIAAGETFESFRTFQLVHDSTDDERRGLAIRRMYRTIAPWCTENPILMHVRSADPDAVRLAIDQSADVGFEMVILTFGSGFNIESKDPEYQAQIRELVEYAHAQGVELGGYSLLSSRRIGDEHDVIDPETGKPGGAKFGNAPCLCSEWGRGYFAQLYDFFEATGLDLLEHDGSYPGDVCASTRHPGHRGLADSQWRQRETIVDFYRWCRGRGIYLNVPDWYFLNGSNKIGMGYRETNWSLPRARQVVLGRQNIFDGTWAKTPSMGWMFVPLVEYHGGGEAATLEPLSEHLDAYGQHLANNFGNGVQACYRGPRLYDSPETRELVKGWVDLYKRHRAILDSDVIHLRRPDGRDLDAMLHVNPRLEERAFLSVYNPTDEPVAQTLRVPLYYAGLTDAATVAHEEGEPFDVTLDRAYAVALDVECSPQGFTYYVFRE